MARVFITGSADGLGRAAAQTLLNDGHEVVVHARNRDRLTAVRDLLDRGAAAVVGDLSDLEETRGLARDVNRLGRLDAVIHNAGVYTGPHVLPVNVVAPYLLTALIDRPQRLVYLSSSEHRSGRPSLTGVDWSGRRAGSYPDSKLFVTTLTVAVARRWMEICSVRFTSLPCCRCISAARPCDVLACDHRQDVAKRAFPWTSRERFPPGLRSQAT